MEQVLVILVANYPYDTGEPFLEPELKVIAPFFKRIIIVNTATTKAKEPCYFVPPNATLVSMPLQIRKRDKFLSFFLQNFRHLFLECKAISSSYHLTISLTHIKTLLASGIKARELSKQLSRYLFRELDIQDNCILYSYWCDDSAYALALLKEKYPSIHTITRMHGWDVYFERHPTAYLPYRQVIFRTLDIFAPISKNGRDYIVNKFPFVDLSRINVSRLGSPPMRDKPYQTSLRDTINILSLSYILDLKRLDRIISALSMVQGKNVIWYHIGGGALQEKIEALAEKSFPGTAVREWHFMGNQSKEEIVSFFEQTTIDCLINASDTEGIPVSMMEALSAGVPLIGPEVGGIPEIITDGVNGYLIRSEKPEAYTAAIEKLIGLSDEAFIRMREQAYQSWQNNYNSDHNFKLFTERIRTAFEKSYLQCSRCILDNRDYPAITFDSNGVCDMCHNYDELVRNTILIGDAGRDQLEKLMARIRKEGEGKSYDCLLGVSGGVDSSYMAWLCKQWKLRPLFVHVDNGWNTELAVDNIERILNKLGFQLHTVVLNWPVMRDLQLAFIKANVIDLDLPTDNAYHASLYKTADQFDIKYILTGHNTSTEGNLPPSFNHYKMDIINQKDIHRKHGTLSISGFPMIGPLKLAYYTRIKRIKVYSPLNWMEYNKSAVKQFLQEEFGWRDYGGKHYENIFTRFYQGYILPEKFGVDKRKAHLSHLVCSGQLTRDEALAEIAHHPPYENEAILRQDREFFIKKLRMTETDFRTYILALPLSHRAYRSVLSFYELLRPFKKLAKRILNFTRNK